MRRTPYGSLGAAEHVLDEFYRQLGTAEARHTEATTRLASLEESNHDHWDLIDDAAGAVDDASDDLADIEDRIAELECEIGLERQHGSVFRGILLATPPLLVLWGVGIAALWWVLQ